MDSELKHDFRYLPEAQEEAIWGVRIHDTGREIVDRGTSYPEPGHPDRYMFTWERGRTLDEYQIVLISSGQGEFESRTGGRQKIIGPSVILLFPEEWHRYRPNPRTGWTCNWVGFNGEYADNLMRGFADPRSPTFRIRADQAMLLAMQRVMRAVTSGTASHRIDAILETLTVIAITHRSIHENRLYHSAEEERIGQARMTILAHCGERIDWSDMSRKLGMSYKTFRRRFGDATGMSPYQYQMRIRMNRAKALLRAGQSVTAISHTLGFSSPFHFSRAFSEREGAAPSIWAARYLPAPETKTAAPPRPRKPPRPRPGRPTKRTSRTARP